jgi:hypothetical protein
MFGFIGPIELIVVVVASCFTIGVPIAIIVLLVRLVAKKEYKGQRPRPKI